MINNEGYTYAYMMHPITRKELWQAQTALLVAIALQLTIANELSIGSKSMVALLELLLVFAIGFTAPRRHSTAAGPHKTLSILIIGLVSTANAIELGLLTKALIKGSELPGKTLLSGALAIFLTNIIMFGLWYWELNSPGLSGRHKAELDDHFQFPQETSSKSTNWKPTFFDYLYLSLTNSTAFSPTDTLPLTHVAKALMSVQALISLLTVVLVTARAVNILG